jgi:hypothetical protein
VLRDQSNVPSVDVAEAFLRQALLTAFCMVMRDTGLSPAAVLSLAAAAVGALYREVSDRHQGQDACCCGWHPRGQKDIEALQVALAAAAEPGPLSKLLLGDPAGRA